MSKIIPAMVSHGVNTNFVRVGTTADPQPVEIKTTGGDGWVCECGTLMIDKVTHLHCPKCNGDNCVMCMRYEPKEVRELRDIFERRASHIEEVNLEHYIEPLLQHINDLTQQRDDANEKLESLTLTDDAKARICEMSDAECVESLRQLLDSIPNVDGGILRAVPMHVLSGVLRMLTAETRSAERLNVELEALDGALCHQCSDTSESVRREALEEFDATTTGAAR